MRKIVLAALIIICAVTVIVSFFLPWATASLNVTKVARSLSESASTTLKETPFAGKFVRGLDTATTAIGAFGDMEVKTAVSGYDIPTMINKRSSKIALSLAQTLFKDADNLDKKSLLVYLLPLFGIVCIVLTIIGLKNNIPVIAMAVISGAISGGGLYKLMTTDLTKLPIQIAIKNGLWQTMYGYLLICVLSIIWLATDRKK
ncbi:MAG: hypothetical protein PHI58_06685 [Candidatus Omnitrophica bacterium]|nr:hypothetical protein [Candidatus Omnitrophota bacterium]